MFEPEKFFIGLIDFFSILLPGAIVAYVLKLSQPNVNLWLGDDLIGRLARIGGEEGVAVFLVVSYLLGHFVFLIGALVLDEVYDRLRNRMLKRQIYDVAWHSKLAPKWQRALLWLVFKREDDGAVDRAIAIKEAHLERIHSKSAVNAFQWSKISLADHTEALATVHRFEADSKFFRSLSVVMLLVAVAAARVRPDISALAAILLLLAFWRFADQRLKSTNQAYWSVITFEADSEDGKRVKVEPSPNISAGAPKDAGGIVYRAHGHRVEYLLVNVKNTKDHAIEWRLPTGAIRHKEYARETAVRQVREQGDTWAAIDGDGVSWTSQYSGDGTAKPVTFFLMRALDTEPDWPKDRSRKRKWESLAGALAATKDQETRRLLTEADKLRPEPGPASGAASA